MLTVISFHVITTSYEQLQKFIYSDFTHLIGSEKLFISFHVITNIPQQLQKFMVEKFWHTNLEVSGKVTLRILATYEAKIAKIRNFWTF